MLFLSAWTIILEADGRKRGLAGLQWVLQGPEQIDEITSIRYNRMQVIIEELLLADCVYAPNSFRIPDEHRRAFEIQKEAAHVSAASAWLGFNEEYSLLPQCCHSYTTPINGLFLAASILSQDKLTGLECKDPEFVHKSEELLQMTLPELMADLRVLTPKLSVHCPALQPAVDFIENPTKAPTDLILVVEARQIDQCGPKLFSIMFDGSCIDCKRTDCECPMDVRIMGTAHEEIAACNGRPFFEKPVFVMVWANFQPVMSATIDSWIALEAGANTLTVLVAKM